MLVLTYRPATFDLLKREPEVDPAAVAMLEARERTLSIRFPVAVREWYSLEGAVEILATYSNDDRPTPLAMLAAPEASGGGLADGLVWVMDENQGVCHWAVLLDGVADPAVFVLEHRGGEADWRFAAASLSTFIYSTVWDRSRIHPAYTVSAWRQSSCAPHRQRLRTAFVEQPRTYGWPSPATFRFSSVDETQHIRVHALQEITSNTRADWYLAGNTPHALKHLIETMWQWGVVDRSLDP
jgi:hypothetical protein